MPRPGAAVVAPERGLLVASGVGCGVVGALVVGALVVGTLVVGALVVVTAKEVAVGASLTSERDEVLAARLLFPSEADSEAESTEWDPTTEDSEVLSRGQTVAG